MKKHRKLSAILALMLAASLALTACGGNGNENANTPNTGDGTSDDGGSTGGGYKQEVIVGLAEDVTNFDPHVANGTAVSKVLLCIHGWLFELDPETNTPIPGIATDLEQVDELTWQFTIRDDVKFHNGDTLTVEDVIFSLERATNEGRGDLYMIDSLEKVDETHLNIHLNQPYAMLDTLLGFNPYAIISQKSTADDIIGCGAYTLANHVSGDRIELERFDDYYRGTPKTEKLTFRVIPEDTARVIALENGEIDIADAVSIMERGNVADDPDLVLLERAVASVEYIGFNCVEGPTADIRVRQALAYATDREEVALAASDGSGVPSTTVAGAGVPYRYENDMYPRDLEKAKALLAEAGYPDGFDLQILCKGSEQQIMAQVLQGQWGEIGVNVDVQFTESTGFFDAINNGNFQSYMLTNNCNNGNFLATMENWYGPYAGSAGNRMLFQNDRFDELFVLYGQNADEALREEYATEMQQIIMEECPAIPLYCPTDAIGTAAGVHEMYVSPGRSATQFKYVYVEQ